MTQAPTVEEVVSYYHETFVPAYADLTAFLADKPLQVLTELENFNSHMMRALEGSVPGDVAESNLRKAKRHLERGTLDCYKLLFVETEKGIRTALGSFSELDIDIALGHTRFPEVRRKWAEYRTAMRDTRKREMENVGIRIDETIDLYRDASRQGFELLELLGEEQPRLDRVKKHFWWADAKSKAIWTVIGAVIGGVLSLGLAAALSP